MATKDKLVSLEVLKATTQAYVNDLKSAMDHVIEGKNIFDPSVGMTAGYTSPAGALDTDTLIPATDTTASNTSLVNKAFKVVPGKQYLFPYSWNSRITLYNPDGVMSSYVTRSQMTDKTTYWLWTPPTAYDYYYIAVALWMDGGVTSEDLNSFMIFETFSDSVSYSDTYIPFNKEISNNLLIPVGNVAGLDIVETFQNVENEIKSIADKSKNIFNPAIEAKKGYGSPSGSLNASTLIPALDDVKSNDYSLIMKAIQVESGKTYAFPLEFVGRLSTYSNALSNGYYPRSTYVTNTGMTTKADCLMWTVPSGIIYICMHIWKSGGVTQDDLNSFMIVEVDDPSTFVFPTNYIAYGEEVKANVPIKRITDYDIPAEDAAIRAELQEKAGRKILNLYDSSDALTTGYGLGTTADIANMTPTGLVSKANYSTSTKLIKVPGGSTVCVSKDYDGEIGVFNPSGGRSTMFSATEMTYENNCLKHSIPSGYSNYYLGIDFNTTRYPGYADFVLAVNVSSLPDVEISHDDYFLDGAKVFAEDIVGSGDFGGEEAKFAYALDSFNEAYAARVQQTQHKNSLTITFKTDSHADMSIPSATLDEQVINVLETGYVGDYLGQDMTIHGGDILTTGYTSKVIPLHNLRAYLNRMYKFSRAPFMVAKGNHDDNSYDTRYTTENYSVDSLILPDEWNAIAMQFAKKFAVCQTVGRANYCYIDNERTKIRVFVLDTEDFDYHVTNNVAEVNSGSVSAFSNDQLNFVANALMFADKKNPNEWAALFVSHRPLDTTTTSGKRMGIGDALIRNVEVMLDIINAYRDGTVCDESGYGGKNQMEIDSHYYPYDVNVDYSSKGQGEVIGFLFGHTHTCNTSDEVGSSSSAKSWGYRYVSCGSNSFYTITFNRDTKKINVYFYKGVKADVQLPDANAQSHEIVGLTANDLNEYGDWETSWE